MKMEIINLSDIMGENRVYHCILLVINNVSIPWGEYIFGIGQAIMDSFRVIFLYVGLGLFM